MVPFSDEYRVNSPHPGCRASAGRNKSRAVHTGARPKTKRILVVDDDPDVREYAVWTLVDAGYDVVPAADGTAALRVIESDEPVDLLFTDVVMPGLDGFEVA